MSTRARHRNVRPTSTADASRKKRGQPRDRIEWADPGEPSRSPDWDESLPLPHLSLTQASLLVFLLACACFANSITADFVFDDSEAVIGNDDLSPDVPVSELFAHDFWGKKLASNTSHKSYRPLTVLTFRWNYYFAGGLHPMGFHLANVILHGVVCVLLLKMFSVIFNGGSPNTGSFPLPKASLLAAILFTVHPAHTESVAGVVGRADLMCALTFILAFLLYAKSCSSVGDEEGGRHSLWLMLSILLTVVSVLFKEQGITVIGVCSAYDVLVNNEIDLLQLAGLRQSYEEVSKKRKIIPSHQCRRSLLVRHFILFVSGVLILSARWRIMGSAPPTFQIVDNPHSFVDGPILRAINYSYLYSINLLILVLPVWLCFDWSMGCIPVIESYTDPRIAVSLLFLVITGSFLLYTLFSRPSTQQRLVLVSVAALVVPFLPASNLLFRVGFVIAERNLYLPSLGFIMLFTLGILKLSRQEVGKVLYGGLILVVLAMIGRCVHRSFEWKDEFSLFHSGLDVCPLNAKVHYNLGKLYGDTDERDLALSYYRHAIKLNPDYDQAMNNLGNLLKDSNDHPEAEFWLQKAVTIRTEFAAAWMNLGIVQAAQGKTQTAEQSYKNALLHRRKYPDCYYNLGNMYLDLKQHALALSAWRNATLQKQTHVSAWCNIIILLDNMGRVDDIEVVAKEAIQYNPKEASIYYNYANALGKANKFQESEKYFHQAIALSPTKAHFHSNLGVLYHRWHKYPQAERAYRTALELDPSNQSTKDNLSMLLKKMAVGKS